MFASTRRSTSKRRTGHLPTPNSQSEVLGSWEFSEHFNAEIAEIAEKDKHGQTKKREIGRSQTDSDRHRSEWGRARARGWTARRTRKQAPRFFADGVCFRARLVVHAPAAGRRPHPLSWVTTSSLRPASVPPCEICFFRNLPSPCDPGDLCVDLSGRLST